MPYQPVTWGDGSPITLQKLGIMEQNDSFFDDVLKEKPKGILFKKEMYNNIVVAKRWKTLVSGFVTVEPDRYYYFGAHVDHCENDASGHSPVRLFVDGVPRSYFILNNTGAVANSDDGSISIFTIFQTPSNILAKPLKNNENVLVYRKKIQFAVKGAASSGNTTFYGSVSSTGPVGMWVEDWGSALKTETAL